jgi:hypothetical protein
MLEVPEIINHSLGELGLFLGGVEYYYLNTPASFGTFECQSSLLINKYYFSLNG